MGLVTANGLGMSGVVAAPGVDVQTFDVGSTTWYRPQGVTRIYMEVIGGGGG